jgi:hypothetical protein
MSSRLRSQKPACGDAKMRELNLTEIETVSGGSLSLEQPDPFPWNKPEMSTAENVVNNPWFQWGAEGERVLKAKIKSVIASR